MPWSLYPWIILHAMQRQESYFTKFYITSRNIIIYGLWCDIICPDEVMWLVSLRQEVRFWWLKPCPRYRVPQEWLFSPDTTYSADLQRQVRWLSWPPDWDWRTDGTARCDTRDIACQAHWSAPAVVWHLCLKTLLRHPVYTDWQSGSPLISPW